MYEVNHILQVNKLLASTNYPSLYEIINRLLEHYHHHSKILLIKLS